MDSTDFILFTEVFNRAIATLNAERGVLIQWNADPESLKLIEAKREAVEALRAKLVDASMQARERAVEPGGSEQ